MSAIPIFSTRLRRRAASLLLVCAVAAGYSLSPALGQTAAPVLSNADYIEIMALYARYPLLLDSHDGDGFANLFTDDGAFGDQVVGRQALFKFAAERAASTVRHVPMTPILTATRDGANGTVLNFFIDVGANPPVITRATQYTDTLVRTPKGWRFKKRVNGAVPGTASASGPGAPAPAAPKK